MAAEWCPAAERRMTAAGLGASKMGAASKGGLTGGRLAAEGGPAAGALPPNVGVAAKEGLPAKGGLAVKGGPAGAWGLMPTLAAAVEARKICSLAAALVWRRLTVGCTVVVAGKASLVVAGSAEVVVGRCRGAALKRGLLTVGCAGKAEDLPTGACTAVERLGRAAFPVLLEALV